MNIILFTKPWKSSRMPKLFVKIFGVFFIINLTMSPPVSLMAILIKFHRNLHFCFKINITLLSKSNHFLFNLNMLKIGVTGSIGSGKSIVCKIFAQLGVPIYNADERAKHLMVSNDTIVKKVKLLFGNESYTENGTLNRNHISKIVFENKQLLQELNQCVHPIVFADFDVWLLEQKENKAPYIIKEAALMFETDSYKNIDKFIVVTAPIGDRIRRTMQRDNITKEEVEARMKNQMSQEEKLAKANFEIKNNEQDSLIEQIVLLHKEFLEGEF